MSCPGNKPWMSLTPELLLPLLPAGSGGAGDAAGDAACTTAWRKTTLVCSGFYSAVQQTFTASTVVANSSCQAQP